MLVYFVRHGQSEGNKNNIHHFPETPLSEDGIRQAETVAKRLQNIHFDLIYASPMARAAKTAEIISKAPNVPIEYWKNIEECGSPSEIRGKKVDDPEVAEIKNIIAKNYHKGDWKYSDEETFNELNERITGVLRHLEKHHKNQTILCVSHSAFIETVAAKVLLGDNLTPEINRKIKKHMYMENTGVTICEYTDKYGWTLKTWNDTTHLK